MKPIWIVDDDQSIRFVLEKALLRENLPTRSFTNSKDVLLAMATASDDELPQVLVSDIRMPGGSGLELLDKIKTKAPGLPVIVMSAYSDLDSAVSAFQGGAFEYLAKPFDLPKAVELIRRAVQESQREAVAEVAMATTPEMLGQAPAMQDVFRAIGRLSQSNVTVLITGESGSGKELVARALHKHSPRGQEGSDGKFIAINTAAIPKDLLESELFGHERGAFTGAQTMRRGRFEQADGGTLFLDEIGDMPFDLQTRLLRVLSDGHFYRVGGHTAIKSNVRVIAATHQDLEQRVQDGNFREDLFHRLNVIRLRLPALRERREDIATLTKHFLQQSAQQLGVEPKRIDDAALQKLGEFSFPGNVRQLENICNWLMVMAPAQTIEPKDLPPEVLQARATVAGQLPVQAASLSPAHSPVYSPPAPQVQFYPAASEALPVMFGEVLPTPSRIVGNLAEAAMPMGAGEGVNGVNSGMAGTSLPADSVLPTALRPPGAAESPWLLGVEAEALTLLANGHLDVWDQLTRKFESKLIEAALANTRGRRIEAAHKLGIGRNTITRKIQELGLDKK